MGTIINLGLLRMLLGPSDSVFYPLTLCALQIVFMVTIIKTTLNLGLQCIRNRISLNFRFPRHITGTVTTSTTNNLWRYSVLSLAAQKEPTFAQFDLKALKMSQILHQRFIGHRVLKWTLWSWSGRTLVRSSRSPPVKQKSADNLCTLPSLSCLLLDHAQMKGQRIITACYHLCRVCYSVMLKWKDSG